MFKCKASEEFDYYYREACLTDICWLCMNYMTVQMLSICSAFTDGNCWLARRCQGLS